MGIAVFLLWREGPAEPKAGIAFSVFWVQLVLNLLWSMVFFGLRSIGGGLGVIVILWLLILVTIILSSTVSTIASLILVPYLVWVSVATYLNAGIWFLNK